MFPCVHGTLHYAACVPENDDNLNDIHSIIMYTQLSWVSVTREKFSLAG